MGTIFEAIEEAQHKYRPAKRRPGFTGDLDVILASANPTGCTCRGKCGAHIGPCGIKASGKSKICKTCIQINS